MCFSVFQYASKGGKSNQVYVWGLAEHGALGERQFIKPEKKQRRTVEYMHRPYRLDFAEENDVMYFKIMLVHALFVVNEFFLILGD